MNHSIQQKIEEWDGLGVICRYCREYDAWFFIALHDDSLGIPVGGTRITRYSEPAEGLEDVMRLASGMTAKWASCDLPFGGGKAVIALSRKLEPEERLGLLERYGDLLKTVAGAFITGEDLGTTPEEIGVLAARGGRILGISPDGVATDPGPFTALGVASGMKAALAHAMPESKARDITVLIQGAGDVGSHLARLLSHDGFRVKIADLNEDKIDVLADELNVEIVAPEKVYREKCDVFAPCARGGILSSSTIPRLRCRIVAGSANNQLLEEEDAMRLHERDILFAPDYVINAGGAIAFGMLDAGITDRDRIRKRIQNLGAILAEVFAKSAQHNESPLIRTRRRVERVLAEARKGANG